MIFIERCTEVLFMLPIRRIPDPNAEKPDNWFVNYSVIIGTRDIISYDFFIIIIVVVVVVKGLLLVLHDFAYFHWHWCYWIRALNRNIIRNKQMT